MRLAILVISFLCFKMQLIASPAPVLKKQRKLTLVFNHCIGNTPLHLEDTVTNIFGETITIQRFRYYVSNFSVTDLQGNKTELPAQYFLIDEAEPASKQIELQVPDIAIKNIGFVLGVDSLKNVSGIQTGALDPAKGMFWTWNSGYVMAKLEGTAETSLSPGHRFTFHVGGFRTGMNTVRAISLAIGEQQQNASSIHISADINHWFKGVSDLRLAETPVCHSPGALAVRIADNYMSMFSVNTAMQ